MKGRNLRIILPGILLGLLFFMQTIGDFLLVANRHGLPGFAAASLELAHLLLPLDDEPGYRKGFESLARAAGERNDELLEESIHWFRKSLRRNPFNPLSHYHLGNALLLFGYPDNIRFNEAVRAMKRAVALKRNDPGISRDTAQVLLSLWPLLEREDQTLCRDLYMETAGEMTSGEIVSFIESWWRFSRDRRFLLPILKRIPERMKLAGDTLVTLGGPLSLRWRLMVDYEQYLLRETKRLERSYQYGHRENLQPLQLLRRMQSIRGFHRLLDQEGFADDAYPALKKRLIIDSLLELLPRDDASGRGTVSAEVLSLIHAYIEDTEDFKDLQNLRRILEKRNFFSGDNLRRLQVHLSLLFKGGDFNQVIQEVTRLKESIGYIPPESRPLFFDILLLQAQSYRAQNLLSLAEGVVRDILMRAPGHTGALALLYEIDQILGTVGTDESSVRQEFQRLLNSREVLVTGSRTRRLLYLLEQAPLVIALDEGFRATLKQNRVVQVFIDGEIVHEAYACRESEELRIDIPEDLREPVVELRIEIPKVRSFMRYNGE